MPQPSSTSPRHVDCVIAGGGPAGAMLGLLLARAGVEVTVVEKHADFLRDFRGDTIHPSTLQVIDELGLIDDFLSLPHQKAARLSAITDDGAFCIADFTRLHVAYPYVAFTPQWEFLDFVTRHARELPGFSLVMEAEAVELVRESRGMGGLRYRGPDGSLHEVLADLTVAADGRDSLLRRLAGLEPRSFGAPMDVLWFRVARDESDPAESFGRLGAGRFLAFIERRDYWQIAYVIPKGSLPALRERGIEAFRTDVARLAPFLGKRTDAIASWDDVRLLTVQVDRLAKWHRPGLLCIGDAAHAMSPMGGVGINLAVQDAVAAANLLAAPLREGRLREEDLARVQRRRMLSTVVVQTLQRVMAAGFIAPVLSGAPRPATPRGLRLLARFPALQGIPARLIGLGVRPEHVAHELRVPSGSGAP